MINFSQGGLYLAFMTVCLFLSSCELMGPKLAEKLPLEERQAGGTEEERIKSRYIQLETDTRSETGKLTVENYPGSGVFVNPRAGKAPPGRPPKEGKYTLNFDDADLGEVAKVILGDTLNKNYAINPKVAGRVTLQTSRPLTYEELIPTLEMILRMNGAVLVREGDVYQIEPAAEALLTAQSPRLGTSGQRLPPGFQVRVIPLRYVSVQEMQKILEPLMPPKGIIRADETRNLLVVAGTARELENVVETVEMFDVDVMKGMSFGLYPLKNADSATIIAELEKVLGMGAEGSLSNMFRLVPIERLNAILVITPQPGYLQEASQWIERLDRSTGTAGGGVNVYRVQNVDAVELAKTLGEIFGKAKKRETPGPTLAPGAKPAEVTSKQEGERAARPTEGASSLVAELGEGVKVIADEINNALVVIASAQEYEIIERVIKQLDVIPLQVLVDATIVEVTLTDELRYGVQWFFENKVGEYSGSGTLSQGANLNLLNSLRPGAFAGGFTYSLIDNANQIRAVLNALSTDSRLNVISSPSLMVLNNQEATIKVGDQIPIRTSESTNTSSLTTQDQQLGTIVTSTIQMRDTGVTLKVKPRVNAGGLVIMEIEQEVDDATTTTTSGIDSPTILQRQIKSSIAVQSGDSIVLGGLIRDNRQRSKTGIPILHRLPLIGPLFGRTDKTLNRTELIVLLTPRVVAERRDALAITDEFKRKLTGIYAELPPPKDQRQNGKETVE